MTTKQLKEAIEKRVCVAIPIPNEHDYPVDHWVGNITEDDVRVLRFVNQQDGKKIF
jgi:hypothetical protein